MLLIDTILKLSMSRYLRLLFQTLCHIFDDLLVCLSFEVFMINHGWSIVCVEDRYRLVVAGVGSLSGRHVHLGETSLEIGIEVVKYWRILGSRVTVSGIWC